MATTSGHGESFFHRHLFPTEVSTNYRELRPDEIQQVAAECAEAWMNPDIPLRQYSLAVKDELDKFRRGIACAPFAALLKCMKHIPVLYPRMSLLDVGASGGYYSEVLAGYGFKYTGIDFSPAFQKLAGSLYPGITFDVGDARALPYEDGAFDVVLHGACIMHMHAYARAIREAARVSGRHVLFHRTPVLLDKPTTAYLKDGYGTPMIELHFNEAELLGLFSKSGLEVIHAEDVFWQGDFGHRTYLCNKANGL